eukprot:11213784-Ditylum_brightwellii.AAC.1
MRHLTLRRRPWKMKETKRQVINNEPLDTKREDDSNSYKLGQVMKYVGGDAMELVTVEELDIMSSQLHCIVKSKDETLFQTTDDKLQYQE